MPKIRSEGRQIPGIDLKVIPGDGYLVARFAAYVDGHTGRPQGEMHLRLGVPFDQIPNALACLKEIGGTLFEVSIRRVPSDQLPEPGW